MSDKLRKKKAAAAAQPALVQMLFGAIHNHEAALARVSRLLHDDVSQILSAVGLQLDAMRVDFRNQAPGLDDRAAEIQSMLERVIVQLRDIGNELNPSIVERAGLQFAMDRLAGKVREQFSGTVRLQLDPSARVPTPIAKAFYKIAEGALDRALASTGCSLIEIWMKRSRGEFVLEIHHNGKTPEAAVGQPSLDRLLMDHYASSNHIVLDVKDSPKGGAVVRASYPAPPADPERAN